MKETTDHPHEHTSHALVDAIKTLPRYGDPFDPYFGTSEEGEYLKYADVLAVVTKGATLGAPVAHLIDSYREDNEPV